MSMLTYLAAILTVDKRQLLIITITINRINSYKVLPYQLNQLTVSIN